MYRQTHRQNYAYAYIHTFFILCTEFLACMHTTVCHSCTHNTKGKTDLSCNIAHLLYFDVQVLPRYPRMCISIKKYTETMPLLSRCCATTVCSKRLIQPLSPFPHKLRCAEAVCNFFKLLKNRT